MSIKAAFASACLPGGVCLGSRRGAVKLPLSEQWDAASNACTFAADAVLCAVLQHRVCYGLSEDKSPADFVCGACHLKLMDPFYPLVSSVVCGSREHSGFVDCVCLCGCL